LGEKLLKGEEK
jgi:hypothetical protein